jgi:mannose-6-phosphate isomerase-like protein (cupin superfamily)
MSSTPGDNLQSTYLRLRPDCAIEKLPVDGTFWPRLMSGELGTFHHEYLVTSYTYSSDWPSWERHPNGDEIVCLISGRVTFVLERDGVHETVELSEPGSFVFVPKGLWHTARTQQTSCMLFITAGEGTQTRPA